MMAKALMFDRDEWLERATDLLAQSLDAWEGEEDS